MFATGLLVNIPVLVMLTFICLELNHPWTPMAIGYLLMGVGNIFLVLTSATDPGVIPRHLGEMKL
jgi:hypothetical protein